MWTARGMLRGAGELCRHHVTHHTCGVTTSGRPSGVLSQRNLRLDGKRRPRAPRGIGSSLLPEDTQLVGFIASDKVCGTPWFKSKLSLESKKAERGISAGERAKVNKRQISS